MYGSECSFMVLVAQSEKSAGPKKSEAVVKIHPRTFILCELIYVSIYDSPFTTIYEMPVETERQLSRHHFSKKMVGEKATVHPMWKHMKRSVRQVGSLSAVGVDS